MYLDFKIKNEYVHEIYQVISRTMLYNHRVQINGLPFQAKNND